MILQICGLASKLLNQKEFIKNVYTGALKAQLFKHLPFLSNKPLLQHSQAKQTNLPINCEST